MEEHAGDCMEHPNDIFDSVELGDVEEVGDETEVGECSKLISRCSIKVEMGPDPSSFLNSDLSS